jgi:site-specific DNA-methyltransferase (adenine-specific)
VTDTPSLAVRKRWQQINEAVTSAISPAQRVVTDPVQGSWLLHGDVFDTLDRLNQSLAGQVAAVFADPPYWANKVNWDTPEELEIQLAFAEEWLAGCRSLLVEPGSLWVCGDYRNVHVLGYALQRLGMRVLSHVAWEKPNPPADWSRQGLVFATESVLWAAKHHAARYRFNDDCLRELNGGKQMRSHWRLAAAARSERHCGRHPTQKPLDLVERCLLATTGPGDLVLDPFAGLGTTLVTARKLGRAGIGIDQHRPYLEIARRRLDEVGEPAP